MQGRGRRDEGFPGECGGREGEVGTSCTLTSLSSGRWMNLVSFTSSCLSSRHWVRPLGLARAITFFSPVTHFSWGGEEYFQVSEMMLE